MTSDAVDFLMSQKDGANYVVLYQMLCLKTINTDGRLSRQIGEILIPYDAEKIQRDTKWFTIDTVRVALELYTHLGLIYRDVDGTLVMADHENLVGSETDYAEKNRRIRANQQNRLQDGGHNVSDNLSVSCPEMSPQILDIRDIDNRDKDKEYRDTPSNSESESIIDTPNNEYGAERSKDHSTQPPEFLLPLNDGTNYEVTLTEINKYAELYPAVDVRQEMRKMIGWLDSHEKRRKTKRGIKGFINNWLSSEQDRGRTKGYKPNPNPDRNRMSYSQQAQGNPFAGADMEFENE